MLHRIAVFSLFAGLLAGQTVAIGSRVGGLELQDLDGKPAPVSAWGGPATVVAFISAECPMSNAFNDRLIALYKEYSAKGVRFVFVDANVNESSREVAAYRVSAGFSFPVYRDPRSQAANQLGASATPETYVIDASGVLRYRGYVEDSQNEARVKSRALRAALDAVLAGKPVAVTETKAFGCTIKRARRTS